MKNLIILLLSFTPIYGFANMASPITQGTLGTRPFVNQYVDIVHEDLSIKIDEDFEHAFFDIKYHINSSKNGIQIPLLFYASEYLDSFLVKIDGKELAINNSYNDFRVYENSKFSDFFYFVDSSGYDKDKHVWIEKSPNSSFGISLDNMLYFETDISKGKHIIQVQYRATKWIDGRNWINKYSFRYALSPAKYWKSFGTLDIEINTTNFTKELDINLGESNIGNIDSIAVWNLDKLPTEILQITYTPNISLTAQFLVNLRPFGLASMIGFLLAITHFQILCWYRERNPLKKYSLVVILGSIFIPLFYVVIWMVLYDIIDVYIGEHASGRGHGYTFFVLFLYPIILPFYWWIYSSMDKQIKKKNSTIE